MMMEPKMFLEIPSKRAADYSKIPNRLLRIDMNIWTEKFLIYKCDCFDDLIYDALEMTLIAMNTENSIFEQEGR